MDERQWFSIIGAQTPEPEIWLYGDIGSSIWSDEAISAKSFVEEWNGIVEGKPRAIHVHINSCGGEMQEAFAICTAIKKQRRKVVVHVDSIAASAASLIAMTGGKIFISEMGTMMIHNVWGGQIGTAEDMRKYADVLDMYNDLSIDAYVERTGQDRETISAAMNETTYYNATEAVAFGLADEIEAPIAMAAHCDPLSLIGRWGKPPEGVMQRLKNLKALADQPTPSTDQSAPGIAGVDDPYRIRAWVDKLNQENHERRRTTRAALERKQRARDALDTA